MYINQTDCRGDTTAKGLFIWANISTTVVQLVFFRARVTVRCIHQYMLIDVAVPLENKTSVKFTEKLSSQTDSFITSP